MAWCKHCGAAYLSTHHHQCNPSYKELASDNAGLRERVGDSSRWPEGTSASSYMNYLTAEYEALKADFEKEKSRATTAEAALAEAREREAEAAAKLTASQSARAASLRMESEYVKALKRIVSWIAENHGLDAVPFDILDLHAVRRALEGR